MRDLCLIKVTPTSTHNVRLIRGGELDPAYLVHHAIEIITAAIGADRLPRPDIPVEAVEDHHESREEPNSQSDVTVHPDKIARNWNGHLSI